jgi:hypothetical protein
MASRECRHIKTNGRRCRSPRLTGRDLCYFHTRLFQRHEAVIQTSAPIIGPSVASNALAASPIELNLPALEDPESIQVSISLLVAALADNRIESKRAAVLLYGLQLASTNAKSITTEPYYARVVSNVILSALGPDLAIGDDGVA